MKTALTVTFILNKKNISTAPTQGVVVNRDLGALNVHLIDVIPNCPVNVSLSFSGEEMAGGIQRLTERKQTLYTI